MTQLLKWHVFYEVALSYETLPSSVRICLSGAVFIKSESVTEKRGKINRIKIHRIAQDQKGLRSAWLRFTWISFKEHSLGRNFAWVWPL